MRVLILVCALAATMWGQASITTVTGKALNTASRAVINANFASLLANAPNGKAALTTAGRLAYVSAAGTLAEAAGFTRTGVGLFQVYDTTATTGVSTFTIRAGAGQSTTALFQWKNNGGTNMGAVNADGSISATDVIFVTSTESTCDATRRGRIVMVQGGAGVADTVRMCVKSAADTYAWTSIIYTGT